MNYLLWVVSSSLMVFTLGCKPTERTVGQLADSEQQLPRPCLRILCAGGFGSHGMAGHRQMCRDFDRLVRDASRSLTIPFESIHNTETAFTGSLQSFVTGDERLVVDGAITVRDFFRVMDVGDRNHKCGLVAVGHSHGGHMAIKQAAGLEPANPLVGLFLIDPIDWRLTPDSFRDAISSNPLGTARGDGVANSANQKAPDLPQEYSRIEGKINQEGGLAINYYQTEFQVLHSGAIFRRTRSRENTVFDELIRGVGGNVVENAHIQIAPKVIRERLPQDIKASLLRWWQQRKSTDAQMYGR